MKRGEIQRAGKRKWAKYAIFLQNGRRGVACAHFALCSKRREISAWYSDAGGEMKSAHAEGGDVATRRHRGFAVMHRVRVPRIK